MEFASSISFATPVALDEDEEEEDEEDDDEEEEDDEDEEEEDEGFGVAVALLGAFLALEELSLSSVVLPIFPSTPRPFRFWNACTASTVLAP